MNDSNNLTATFSSAAFIKPVLIGAGIGLALITFFLVSAGEGNPEWPRFWMIRPLVVVPLAGAAGGAFFYFMRGVRRQGGWKGALAYVISLIVFVFLLWIGSVLGLDGTYWN